MRWAALGVDYEMFGKDHLVAGTLRRRSAASPAARRRSISYYELFLDENGPEDLEVARATASRSTNGWPTGRAESIALFMFQKPRVGQAALFRRHPEGGRRLSSICSKPITPRSQRRRERMENPVWHIHDGQPPAERYPVSFALLLNLVSRSNAHDRDVLWGFIRAYAPEPIAAANPGLDRLVGLCAALLRGFRQAAEALSRAERQGTRRARRPRRRLDALGGERDARDRAERRLRDRQAHGFEPLRDWFKALYEVLFGQTPGPALRLLRRPVRLRGDGGADPPRARGRIRGAGMTAGAPRFVVVCLRRPAPSAAETPLQSLYRRPVCARRWPPASRRMTRRASPSRRAPCWPTTMMRAEPCIECLKRAEDAARRAIAGDPKQPDGHIYLAAALGYRGAHHRRSSRRSPNGYASKAKTRTRRGAADDPNDAWALAALGGWHIEIVRGAGGTGALAFRRARRDADWRLSPRRFAVRRTISPCATSMRWHWPPTIPGRFQQTIEDELDAPRATPHTAYEKHSRARPGPRSFATLAASVRRYRVIRNRARRCDAYPRAIRGSR